MNAASILAQQGFVMLKRYRPEMGSDILASRMGTVVEMPRGDSRYGITAMQVLVPRDRHDAEGRSYTRAFGHDSFPLHSDLAHWAMPPRYMMLRCARGRHDVSTHLLPSKGVINEVGQAVAARALFRTRRPVNGRLELRRALEVGGSEWCFRWDSLFLRPENADGVALASAMRQPDWSEATRSVCLVDPGDTLVVDNWHVLHGRSAAPPAGAPREIHRAYLSSLAVGALND